MRHINKIRITRGKQQKVRKRGRKVIQGERRRKEKYKGVGKVKCKRTGIKEERNGSRGMEPR